MWFEDKGILSIGCQSSGPNNGIGKIKVDLYKLIYKFCTSTYCSEVDHYALVLRVGGRHTDYDEEKIWKLRRHKKDRYIGIDIDIPKSVWTKKTTDELKVYLSEKVIEAVEIMILRLRKDKVEIEEKYLLNDLRNAISEFNKITYENDA
ncbi:hypothetical protein [Arenicella xantha]|uniref:Uncharacterized protein n=1 Tax=Arenicella xantha TaxID=644221 RepID=A0A395JKP0_9GAMM|nr:hypothetical protein [Arenicella xantha]RBP49348.1 hypothetical protein DFR28_104279 [Arenicella xantha]